MLNRRSVRLLNISLNTRCFFIPILQLGPFIARATTGCVTKRTAGQLRAFSRRCLVTVAAKGSVASSESQSTQYAHSSLTYRAAYDLSMADPQGFWSAAARDISWHVAPTIVLDISRAPHYEWFKDGALNICYNAVDRHVDAGRGNVAAIVHESPVTGAPAKTLTYEELRDETSALAAVLQAHGVTTGDRVLIYMPMIPEAVVAMLACARIGAIHTCVFGGFASGELAVRIDATRPTVVLAASCGIEGPNKIVLYGPLLAEALRIASHSVRRVVMLQRSQGPAALVPNRDVDWHSELARVRLTDAVVPVVPVPSLHPSYILATSGSTGRPKQVVRDTGGHAAALMWAMQAIYGLRPSLPWVAFSDLAWVAGHTLVVWGPLLVGATTVLYEGSWGHM